MAAKKTLKERTTFRSVDKNGKIETNNNFDNYVPIGKIVTDLNKDSSIIPTTKNEIKEQSKSMNVDFIDNLMLAVENGKKAFNKNFFISVLLKSERLLTGVFRNYFHPRITCPEPFYDQSLFRYDHLKEEVEFIWVVPDEYSCKQIYSNRFKINNEDIELLPYVTDFIEGRLHLKQIKFNEKIEENL